MEILQKVLNKIDKLNEMCGKIFGFLNLFLILIVSYEVSMRYLFNRPNVWSMEATVFMMGSMAFLGGGYTLLHDHHVKVDILTKKLSKRARASIDVFTYLLLFIMCGVLAWLGGIEAFESFIDGRKTESAWGAPLWISQSIIPIGASLVFIQGLAKWIRDWVIMWTGEDKLGTDVVGRGGIAAMAKLK